MSDASDELTAALVSVLHNVATGSVDGCMLLYQANIYNLAAMLLTSNGPHDDKQDEQLAAIIKNVCQTVPQAQVCRTFLIKVK